MRDPEAVQSTSPQICGVPADEGFLESSRRFLLGKTASKWLDKNQGRAFGIVETHMEQAEAGQSIINNLLENYRLGILPVRSVAGPEGSVMEVEISPLEFGQKLMDLIAVSGGNVERAVSVRNKVSTGGVNLMTSAILASESLRLQASRRERSATGERRVLGTDALKLRNMETIEI